MRQSGNEDAVSSEAWLEQTLDEILARVRELLDVTGCAFQVVDWERGQIRPAAAWFADEETREALDAVLTRPYDPDRGGVTEAAIESGRPLLIDSVEDWAGAERLHQRLYDQLGPEAAARAWRGTRARRTSRARSAPPTGGRSACSRSRARTRGRP